MYNAKTLIRDTLVNNATIKGYFAATLTGSCNVNMADLQWSATYPQVIVQWVGGATTPGMNADDARIYLTIESQGSGSTLSAYKEIGKFRSTILSLIDDTNLSGTATIYHLRKTNELEGYDEDTKVYYSRIGFDCITKQSSNTP